MCSFGRWKEIFHHWKKLMSVYSCIYVFKDDKKSCVLPVGLGAPLFLCSSCKRDFIEHFLMLLLFLLLTPNCSVFLVFL